MSGSVAGHVVVMGVPLRGVEVLAVAGSKVVASTRTDGDGAFAFADSSGVTSVAARITEPFLGVVVRPVADAAIEISIDRGEIVRLSGTLTPPANVAFDWCDVKLTPRVELPPVVVLWDPAGLHEAFWIHRYIQPAFEVRVLRGTWELRAGREIDAPPSVTGPTNLSIKTVTLDDGSQPAAKFMGYEFKVDGDVSVVVDLQRS